MQTVSVILWKSATPAGVSSDQGQFERNHKFSRTGHKHDFRESSESRKIYKKLPYNPSKEKRSIRKWEMNEKLMRNEWEEWKSKPQLDWGPEHSW